MANKQLNDNKKIFQDLKKESELDKQNILGKLKNLFFFFYIFRIFCSNR